MPPKKSSAAKAKSTPKSANATNGVAKESRVDGSMSVKEPPNGEPSAGAAATVESESVHTKAEPTAQADVAPQKKPEQKNPSNKKRKQPSESTEQPQKAARRSGRGVKKAEPSQEQLLNFLLSPDAAELCRPEDETEAIAERGDLRNYSSSALTPFEELLCAVILSRPISHRLGLRSIRTIFNDPYNFTSAKAIQDAGEEKRHQALWDAKTQHKGKTADQIGLLADVALEKFSTSDDKEGTRLQKALDDSDNDVDKALELLKENIKGLGKTGLDIFLRRVQWLWEAGYPYVDSRSMQGLKQLGLPDDAEELQAAIEDHWSKLKTKDLAGDDDATKKRRAFVVILERATGGDLEGKANALLEAAATS